MKKIIAMLLCLLLVLALCACGQEPTVQPDNDTPENNETVTSDYDKLYYESKGYQFGIGDKLEDVQAAIGEPMSTFEADSCAYQGKDYFYYYDGFELMANELDGALTVTGITVDDDTVKIPQGVKIGMDITEALSLMDVDYTEGNGIYKFTEGSTILRIREGDDGTVAAIEYMTAAQE